MAITCAFGIDLHNLRTHSDFNLFYGIEDKRAQPAVKTIKVNNIFEVNIFASEVVFGTLSVFLKRISISTKPIIADIEQISSCIAFIIENKPPLF